MTDKANSLIQELVDKCNRLWRGEKIDFNADKAYNLIERIYEEIKEKSRQRFCGKVESTVGKVYMEA